MAHANDDRTPVSNMMTVEEKAKVFDEVLVRFGAKEEREQLLGRPLEVAASVGNVDLMRKLLVRGASAHTTCLDGIGLLHMLAIEGNPHAVRALLEYGADANALDRRGRTALQLAALYDNPDTAASLLSGGARVNFRPRNNRTALELAALRGNVGVMTTLLRHGADVRDANSDGCSALHIAVEADRVDTIRVLVAARADINALDFGGRTPLHVASQKNFPASVAALCELGADKNEPGGFDRTPLEDAILFGDRSMVVALLDAGAGIGFRRCDEGDELSALSLASLLGKVDIVRLLLRYGADVDAVDTNGRTALHRATDRDETGTGAIDVLVGAGATVDAQDVGGRTPLHRSAGKVAIGAVHALLNHGASVSVPDKWGQTPLHRAACVSRQDNSAEVVATLVRWGADEMVVDGNRHTAAEAVGQDVLQALAVLNLNLLHPAASNARVIDLLAKAPEERAWRRRNFLTMCRARLDRAKLKVPERDAASHQAKMARVGGGGGEDDAAGNVGDRGIAHRGAAERASVVARVVGLAEEGLFRNVVGFL